MNAGGMLMISTKRHSLFGLLKNINNKISKADEGAHEAPWQLALECFWYKNNEKNIYNLNKSRQWMSIQKIPKYWVQFIRLTFRSIHVLLLLLNTKINKQKNSGEKWENSESRK